MNQLLYNYVIVCAQELESNWIRKSFLANKNLHEGFANVFSLMTLTEKIRECFLSWEFPVIRYFNSHLLLM